MIPLKFNPSSYPFSLLLLQLGDFFNEARLFSVGDQINLNYVWHTNYEWFSLPVIHYHEGWLFWCCKSNFCCVNGNRIDQLCTLGPGKSKDFFSCEKLSKLLNDHNCKVIFTGQCKSFEFMVKTQLVFQGWQFQPRKSALWSELEIAV